MRPVHHPSAAVLTDYVSGAMRPAFAVVVAAHVERCAHCRAEVAALEAAGGALIGELPPSAMGGEALAQAMARIERPYDAAKPAVLPASERIPFGRRRWLGPGMSIRKARIGDGPDLLYLLTLPAGVTTVPHGHGGEEFTVVLTGAFHDGTGVFAPGDFAEMTETIDHQPVVAPDGPCVCLIASARPMRMTTPLGRVVQWLTGV